MMISSVISATFGLSPGFKLNGNSQSHRTFSTLALKHFLKKKGKKKKVRYLFVNNKKKIYLLVPIISNDDIAIVISY